jgi:8-oxo-dGTP diphosphatase
MYVNVRAIIERNVKGKQCILLQIRDKPNQPKRYELPGGCLEEYEPLISCLAREIAEETGMNLIKVIGEESRIKTNLDDTEVECVRPFSTYQTLKGPVDSIGIYFRCLTSGEPIAHGDGTKDAQWVDIRTLEHMIDSNPKRFDWVDITGLTYYVEFMNRY